MSVKRDTTFQCLPPPRLNHCQEPTLLFQIPCPIDNFCLSADEFLICWELVCPIERFHVVFDALDGREECVNWQISG
jgi:hypothetical protein